MSLSIIFFPRRVVCMAATLVFAVSTTTAEPVTLYLLNGTSVRGEIVDRSKEMIDLKTVSGKLKVKTSTLMPISRQQLKLPAEEADQPAMESLLSQMEKIIAENEALKKQVAELTARLAKSPEPTSPAEGPSKK